ncbi:HAD-IA family hydrolase [Amantichitinum ursilacus]|uniref:Sugar phosphatase YfbT n=1 Tax=Amantichitinum ursilacus TaxID=857265 RepID=A0A0N0XMJ4_9NEIS|nr:HAD-IA family hydrolase [Amantichitinum ursilacus]KPC54757.1 Sugar phosphatase YfbT [Amantichitinum ursilacus]
MSAQSSSAALGQPVFGDRSFAAFLFDMDGTILSSIAAAERVWGRWAEKHGLDVAAFIPTIHGQRGVDTIAKQNLPGIDITEEADWITREELIDLDGIDAIAGVAAFLASLPQDKWAVVTSAPRELALKRIAAAGLPVPPMIVASEDVQRGKPAPDCFLLGAQKLGVEATQCLVFEDAPAGIAGAEAAGAHVMVVTATHDHQLTTAHPTLDSYKHLSVQQTADGRLQVFAR